jgi:peptidoglycan/LPS O-acetylase OafA/YrhL
MLWQWTTGGAPRVLDNRAVHAVGRWSYGVYLVHLTIGQHLIEHLPSGMGRYETAAWLTGWLLILSVAFAAALWRFWELPWMERRLPWRAATS